MNLMKQIALSQKQQVQKHEKKTINYKVGCADPSGHPSIRREYEIWLLCFPVKVDQCQDFTSYIQEIHKCKSTFWVRLLCMEKAPVDTCTFSSPLTSQDVGLVSQHLISLTVFSFTNECSNLSEEKK